MPQIDSQCQAAELVHTLGDAHIYSNHVEPLKIQVYGRIIDWLTDCDIY